MAVTFVFSDSSEVTLDAALSERPTGKVSLTKFPIETGMQPSDSATLQPTAFSVEGIFSNRPVLEDDQQARSDGQFVSKMIDLLWATLAAREALTVVTETKRFENMVMTSLAMPRTAETGEAVQFTADFEEVRFVNTQTVRLAPKQTSVPQKTTSKDKQGTKVAQPASAELNQSIAKWGSDTGGFSTAGSGVVSGSPGN